MDQSHCTSVVCKVSVVNESGHILLDTLVNPEAEITRSLYLIHGVKQRWLTDAPTITQVRQHLQQICGKSVFIGHSVKHDLNALQLFNVYCIDTYCFEEPNNLVDGFYKTPQPKKLKELTSSYLNA